MQRGRGREDARRGSRLTPRVEPAAAILAAGGSGSRAALPPSDHAKQFKLLAGKPVAQWSIDALKASGCDPVIVVVPLGAEPLPELPSGIELVEGGPTRQRSVFNGLQRVARERVIVHDAARPLVQPELIARVLAALDDAVGAIAAVPVGDTLKRVADGAVLDTVVRDGLWRSQTPQAFRTVVLREAHARAAREGLEATDDAQLVETFDLGRVALVEGSRSNIKVTWPEDFEVAEAILRSRS